MKIVIDEKQLRQKCTNLTMAEIVQVSKNFNTYAKFMINNGGCGLASPQIGIHKRFFLALVYGRIQMFINPEIVEYGEEMTEDYERCLSVPNIESKIPRHEWIKIKYFNIQERKIVTEIYRGFSARVIQHEYDHLNGIICVLDKGKEPRAKGTQLAN